MSEALSKGLEINDAMLAASPIEKVPSSWQEYTISLKYKHKDLSLASLIVCITIKEQDLKLNNKRLAEKSNFKKGKKNVNTPSLQRNSTTLSRPIFKMI